VPPASRAPYAITHIFFDVDGTLVDFRASLRAGLEAAATLLSERTGRLVTPAVLTETRDRFYQQGRERRTLTEVRAASFQQVLAERGVTDPDAAAEASRVFYEARDGALAAYDDVVEPLRVLRERGFRLATATNGNAALMRTPVMDLMHVLFGAEEAGLAKPHPAFFEAALAKAGAETSRSLMVGDRIDNDVAPALAAGMHGVLLDREGTVDTSADPGMPVIRSLRDLPSMVVLPDGP